MQWSEIELNQEFTLVKPPIEKVQLVKYAGASGDYNVIHTDDEAARQVGLPGVIAYGMLNMGFLGQLAAEIAGNEGFVSRLQVRFTGMVFPGDTITCRAKVTAKDEEKRTAEMDLSAEKEAGQVIVSGSATIKFLK